MSGRFGALRYNCIGCNAPIAEDGTADHRPYCEYGPKQPDLLSLADALAEAAREAKLQIEYLSDKFAPTGTGNTTIAKLAERLAAWDAARKAGR